MELSQRAVHIDQLAKQWQATPTEHHCRRLVSGVGEVICVLLSSNGMDTKAVECAVRYTLDLLRSAPIVMDLHGYALVDALRYVRDEIENAKDSRTLHIITGKGIHSGAGGAVIKQDVQRLLASKKLRWKETDNNSGQLEVWL